MSIASNMGPNVFSKLEERWRRERDEREARSAELRRLILDRGAPVLRSYGVREGWLFGSVAAGRAGPASDLDLLVMPVAVEDYWSLRRKLIEVVGCQLDLYTQDDDPEFVRKVTERGELIYTRHPRVFGRDARLSHPIAVLRLLPIEPCYYSSPRLALGHESRTSPSRKPTCDGYMKYNLELLKRMKLDVDSYRPAVIDDELYSLLEDFRGFRHVFRHSYSFELDWDRERLVARKLRRAAAMLRDQVKQFILQLAAMDED